MNRQKRIEKWPSNGKPAGVLSDPRRSAVLALAIVLLIGSCLSWWFGKEGAARFAAGAMGRIGLVMAALWLAWPSLRRPAQWLPPGVAVLGVVSLGVLAAHPRMVIVVVPALSAMIALAAVIRGIRSGR